MLVCVCGMCWQLLRRLGRQEPRQDDSNWYVLLYGFAPENLAFGKNIRLVWLIQHVRKYLRHLIDILTTEEMCTIAQT